MCDLGAVAFSRRQWLLTGLLTTACIGTYFGLRSIPVKACNTLHYGDYLKADGVVEGCGFEESGFFDLDAMRFPIFAMVEPLAEPKVGQPTSFLLSLQTSVGRSVSYEEIAISHTERVHAMIVDPSLEDYHHVHPSRGNVPGSYTFTVTPHRAGEYSVYLDFIPLVTARRTLAVARFAVPGDPSPLLLTRPRVTDTEAGLTVQLVSPLKAFETGTEIPFRLEISSPDAAPLCFDPIMDSYAHLVAFAPDRNGFAHFHPRNPIIGEQDPRAPELDFIFRVDDPGDYRVWAQFSVNGQERFVPFDVHVHPAN